jgi:archaellum component FlaC
VLLEEVRRLREAVELSDKVKDLENEICKLKREVKTLKEKLPQEILEELGEFRPPIMRENEEEEAFGEECLGCDEEELI